MWSEKKTINITINVLLFLIGINIFHYAQLLLPIICLILFIDNKYRLNIKNIKIFVILCLFGVSFFAFSYKLGLYGIVGLCLPMAYYIGSNLKNNSENNVINLIYILALGMATHIVLNFGYELTIYGLSVFNKVHHCDIWTGDYISTTGTAMNYTLLIGILYYVIFYEKNKNIKNTFIGISIIAFIYNIALGRRTPILMFAIAFALSYFFDLVVFKNRKLNRKILIGIIISLVILVLTIIVCIYFNFANIRNLVYLTIILKFYNFGLNPERLQIFIEGIKLMPKHLFGGQLISATIDSQIHDLWMDTYDYAGLIPFVLLIIYSVISIKDTIKKIKSKVNNKSLFIVLFLCILMQMLLEPVMTGSSIFLISSVIILSAFTSLN